MRSVGSHSTSGREKEGKQEWIGRLGPSPSIESHLTNYVLNMNPVRYESQAINSRVNNIGVYLKINLDMLALGVLLITSRI